MGEGLDFKRIEKGDVLVLQLSGNITEDSQIEDIAENLKPAVVLDLKNVQRINSYGIRQWVNVMKQVAGTARQLVFHRCPPAFVEQFNMISNFGGGGVVYSFFLPYYCEATDKEHLILYEIPGGVSPDKAPELASDVRSAEGHPMTFNDIEDEYFYFLEHQKGRKIEPEIVKAIKELA